MCRKGNHTVFRYCREEVVRISGQNLSNKEAQILIKAHGGCFMDRWSKVSPSILDSKKLVVAK